MKMHISPACARLAGCATVWFAGASSSGALQFEYVGLGFTEQLVDSVTADVRQVAFGDFDRDGTVDLAVLNDENGGTVVLHRTYAEYDQRDAHPEPVVGLIAATRSECDRLWATAEGRLKRLTWSLAAGGWVSEEDTSITCMVGIEFLRAQERPLGSYLLTIGNAWENLLVRKVTSSCDETMAFQPLAFELPPSAGPYHDLALVDWNGDAADELAVLNDDGLWLCPIDTPTGAAQLLMTAPSEGAFLEVLAAGGVLAGRDVLFYHFKTSPSAQATLLAANSGHLEVIPAGPNTLDHICFADVLPGGGTELILPRGDEPEALIATQVNTNPLYPYFAFDYGQTALINLSPGTESTPDCPPATAACDLDGDGDHDVLFANDLGLGMVMTSNKVIEDNLRVHLSPSSYPTKTTGGDFLFNIALSSAQSGIDRVELEIWFQNAENTDPWLWYDDVLQNPPFQGSVNEPLETPLTGIYHILFRPFIGPNALPVKVVVWSADPDVFDDLVEGLPLDYPWAASPPSSGIGVVRRPKIHPIGPH